MKRFSGWFLGCALVLTMGAWALAENAEEAFKRAETAFDKKNYKDAAEAYAAVLKADPKFAQKTHVRLRLVVCGQRLSEWDQALEHGKALASEAAGTVWEARANNLLASVYWSMPHWGSKKGEELIRGQHKAGYQYVYFEQEDRAAAVKHGELARERYLALLAAADKLSAEDAQSIPSEAVANNFELSGYLAQQAQWYGYRRHYRGEQRQIQVPGAAPEAQADPHAELWKPVEKYAAELSEAQKVLFLLGEIPGWDKSESKEPTALAGYRRALYVKSYWNSASPKELDPALLLNEVSEKYASIEVGADAQYARGLLLAERGEFVEAVKAFETVIAKFPKSVWVKDAAHQKQEIVVARLELQPSGAQLPGGETKLTVQSRNLKEIEFTAWRVKLEDVMAEPRDETRGYDDYVNSIWQGDRLLKHKGEQVAAWKTPTTDKDDHRFVQDPVAIPFNGLGAYLIEAKAGGVVARQLLVVSDLSVVRLSAAGSQRFFVADAITGKPVEGAALLVDEAWHENNAYRHARATVASGELGLYEHRIQRPNSSYVQAFAHTGGRYAMTHHSWANGRGREDAKFYRVYPTTDRPVYRPGQTVYFKASARLFEGGEYALPGEIAVQVAIQDPKNNKIYNRSLTLSAQGSLADQLVLPAETPLGMYRIDISSPALAKQKGGRFWGSLNFRVEEYKKPEFEVSVKPEATQAKMGEPVKAQIQAKYYFGAPVAEGTVTYRVFRTPYYHRYTQRGRYDWLYGEGYGKCAYPLDSWGGYWRWQHYGQQARELISEETRPLTKDGTAEVAFETKDLAARFPDQDHRFEIEAEVVDASRRTITGSGAITVTRNQFYVFLNGEQGFYRPGDKVKIEVTAQTPDGAPVAAKGKLVVSKVAYEGEKNEKMVETKLTERAFETDAEGRGLIEETLDESAQYKFAFVTEDAWKTAIEGTAFVWIRAEDFDAGKYRFRDLEVITDKRSYEEGEIAHLMINTNRPDSHVLLVHDLDGRMDSFTVLHLPQKSKLIDLKVEKKHAPNFFIQALSLRDGQVFTENREIFVPPAKQFLDVKVSSNKGSYQPGEKGTFSFETRGHDGQPVQAELAFTLFDSSILYFQRELAPEVKTFFFGQKRNRQLGFDSSHNVSFRGIVAQHAAREEFDGLHGYPPAYWGNWANDNEEKLRGLTRESGQQAGQGGGGAFGYRERKEDLKKAGEMQEQAAAKNADGKPALAAAMPGAPPAEGAENRRGAGRKLQTDEKNADRESDKSGGSDLVEAEVRSNFADSAAWAPRLLTGPDGKATLEVTFPDSLTTWKGSTYGMSAATQVGSASTSVITTKNLLVRLQAPRFFVERDEVVLSANVHNYLPTAKKVKCEIQLPSGVLACTQPLVVDVEVPAGGEKRLDWTVKVLQEGAPKVLVKALTDEESDAMALTFPALVHGTEKFLADNGSYRPDAAGVREVSFSIPEERKPEATELRVTLSPSLAGAMLDALPYLLEYPYGCAEQTMSRFLPAVLSQQTLKQLGVNLEDLETKRKQINPAELQAKYGYLKSPVFDSSKLASIVQAGARRLYDFQNGDGGWGWWKQDQSNPNMTAYVLYGLKVAKDAGVAGMDEGRRQRGLKFLLGQVGRIHQEKEEWWRQRYYGLEQEAYASYVLALDKQKDDKALNMIWEQRDKLNVYGKALLALTLNELADERKQTAYENVLQYVKEDKEHGTAWVETPSTRAWYWYNNEIESNAWALKTVAKFDPKGELAPKLTKHLLGKRHGQRWHTTKDTAIAIFALADYMVASGETEPNYTVTIDFDGLAQKTVAVNKENFFTFDNQFVIRGADIPSGARKVTLKKDGPGALYYSAQVKYFTKEGDIKAAGNEISVVRTYYKLTPKQAVKKVKNAKGEEVEIKELEWDRAALEMGAVVKSGEQVEVELKVKAPNDYEYVIVEDPKAAGCEPVDLVSGGRYGDGLCSNMELRDTKVVFFMTWLPKGEHTLKYKLRAEIPGTFHALPTSVQTMYSPDVRAISDEMRLGIKD
ncbi:MAG: tetratricopeptide repeat protein [Planctomycetes bacterium]|nr:tetratricopeptide repeat protein [Planctomycetota bacterium]